MGRTLRTNSSSGGASTSAGLTLDDISTAFDAPRLLKTVDVLSPLASLEFTNLDTTTYEHFRLHIDHMGGQNANWMQAGPMSGAAQHNPNYRTAAYWRALTNGDNQQGTGVYYPYASSDMMGGAASTSSNIRMVWDFYWPDPSVGVSSNNATIAGSVWRTPSYSYGHKSFFEMFEWRNSAHRDGFWLAPQTGFNKHGNGNGAYPMRCTLFGNKRRAAAA